MSEVRNTYTDEKVYQMTPEGMKNVVSRMAINEADLLGNRQSDGVLRDRYGFRAECNFNKMLIKY